MLAILLPDLDSGTFTSCIQPLHMHRRIIMSHNLITEIKRKLKLSNIGKQIAFHHDLMSKITDFQSIPQQMQELSPCLRPNPKSILWLAGGYLQEYNLTSSTACALSKGDESGSAAGSRSGMLVFDCSFAQPTLIWLLPGREVPCGICDIPRTMSRHSIHSPNAVGAGDAVSSSVCSSMTAETLNPDVLYTLSLAPK